MARYGLSPCSWYFFCSCNILLTTDLLIASGMPAQAQGGQHPLPMAQYSTLANYDGSYSRRRHSQPPPPAGRGVQLPSGIHPAHLHQYPHLHPTNGVPIVPSNGPGFHSSPFASASTGGSGGSSSSAASKSQSHMCEDCGQTFTRAHDKKRHAQIHTRQPDEGPKCQWCKKKFSRDDALKRHLDNGCDDMSDEVYARRRLA
jgi:hypothetical protein